MGFDKGINGTVVTISLLALVGLLVVGATPAAAQSNGTTDDGPPEFDFDIEDGEDFGFDGDDSSGDEQNFDFGDISDGSQFDFSGIGENGDGSDFSGIGDDGDAPDFGGIGDDGDAPDFGGIGEDGDGPDFGGIGDDGDAPDFGGIGEDGDAPDFDDIAGDDGGDEKDGGNGDNETTPANFQVSNLNAPAEATVGDTITVTAKVENVGGSEATQSVSFGIDTDDDGELEEIQSQSVNLDSGGSDTVTFDVDTSALAAGTYTHGVSSANDTAEAQITLNSQRPDQPANFQVQNIDTNSPVTEGETLTVDATIENIGDRDGTQTVTLSVLDESDSSDVTLAGSATQDVTLSVPTQSGDAGTSSAQVQTANDSVTTTVEVTNDSDSGTGTYQSFTAYTEDGYISVGNSSTAGYGEIPHCPQGEAETDTGCVYFNASFDQSSGEYTVSPENFYFPVINFTSNTLGPVPTDHRAQDTISGSLDPADGSGSFEAPIFANLQFDLGEDCGIPVNVAGTTGQSGNLTGSAADPDTFEETGTAEATLVDNEFEVPSTEGCGGLNSTVNGDVGLPAGSGVNEMKLELYIEFHEEPVDQLGN